MFRPFLIFSGISGIIAVVLGAMAAHFLPKHLNEAQLHGFETGVKYQFYHTLGLMFIALLALHISNKNLKYAGYLFITGIILFPGSIYLLSTSSLTGLAWGFLGPVTPLGGLCFIAGWMFICFAAIRSASFHTNS